MAKQIERGSATVERGRKSERGREQGSAEKKEKQRRSKSEVMREGARTRERVRKGRNTLKSTIESGSVRGTEQGRQLEEEIDVGARVIEQRLDAVVDRTLEIPEAITKEKAELDRLQEQYQSFQRQRNRDALERIAKKIVRIKEALSETIASEISRLEGVRSERLQDKKIANLHAQSDEASFAYDLKGASDLREQREALEKQLAEPVDATLARLREIQTELQPAEVRDGVNHAQLPPEKKQNQEMQLQYSASEVQEEIDALYARPLARAERFNFHSLKRGIKSELARAEQNKDADAVRIYTEYLRGMEAAEKKIDEKIAKYAEASSKNGERDRKELHEQIDRVQIEAEQVSTPEGLRAMIPAKDIEAAIADFDSKYSLRADGNIYKDKRPEDHARRDEAIRTPEQQVQWYWNLIEDLSLDLPEGFLEVKDKNGAWNLNALRAVAIPIWAERQRKAQSKEATARSEKDAPKLFDEFKKRLDQSAKDGATQKGGTAQMMNAALARVKESGTAKQSEKRKLEVIPAAQKPSTETKPGAPRKGVDVKRGQGRLGKSGAEAVTVASESKRDRNIKSEADALIVEAEKNPTQTTLDKLKELIDEIIRDPRPWEEKDEAFNQLLNARSKAIDRVYPDLRPDEALVGAAIPESSWLDTPLTLENIPAESNAESQKNEQSRLEIQAEMILEDLRALASQFKDKDREQYNVESPDEVPAFRAAREVLHDRFGQDVNYYPTSDKLIASETPKGFFQWFRTGNDEYKQTQAKLESEFRKWKAVRDGALQKKMERAAQQWKTLQQDWIQRNPGVRIPHVKEVARLLEEAGLNARVESRSPISVPKKVRRTA